MKDLGQQQGWKRRQPWRHEQPFFAFAKTILLEASITDPTFRQTQ